MVQGLGELKEQARVGPVTEVLTCVAEADFQVDTVATQGPLK